ncbi:exonuclease SbcC [Halarchaeum solikamskense]|uniref:DNA double-strand break repair ATPase Rad50 n=1 Tax=Halarchaeum nitratireducens TaxID=489913 RepID=UPI001B3AF522|nr:DNA double-strand break repair ATPase Rad50 [Halarchaeum solikamskense]MBP2252214.1 exonuclease SbcC [Halarchaeum solikamskense]
MRVDRLRLRNFKCYEDADVSLDSGVTVIHGLNGSGKSSLLEACFFALYGATPLDRTLDEIVTIGAEEAEVDLWFTHAGGSFHLHRRVRHAGERASTADCTLETPDDTIDGARDVRDYVVDLLRMDADAFVNCAYVRQGEVNKLINASPGERQDMIDDLLQLGKLEAYRQRAEQARRGVQAVRDGRAERLDTLDEQVAELEARDLHAGLNEAETELAAVEDEIETFEANREQAAETKADAERVIEEYADRRAELDELTETVADLKEQITETEREREELADAVSTARERVEGLDERIERLLAETDIEASPDDVTVETVRERRAVVADERDDVQDAHGDCRTTIQTRASEAESKRERAAELAERAAEARERAVALDGEAREAAERVAEADARIDAIDAEREELRDAFVDAPVDPGEAESYRESIRADLDDVRERESDLKGDLQAARAALAEAEELRDAGKCPECGQSVEGSPHVDAIDERRDAVESIEADLDAVREEKAALEADLERANELVDAESELETRTERRADVTDLRDGHADAVESKRDEAEAKRDEAADLEERADAAREAAAEADAAADDARERLGELNGRIADLKDRLETLDDLADALADRESAANDRENARDRRTDLEELNDERRERLADARERKRDLEAEFDEERLAEARTERDRAAEYLEQVEAKLDELSERRDDVRDRITALKKDIGTLEDLREKRDAARERVEALDDLVAETEALEATYGDLRGELRQRNVEKLERLLNETFDLVYGNDSYARLELDGNYELTVYQKDGETLRPDQLSGGERALFNLSLRCAVYRLLAEGIDGAAPLPPLILDEPTVFLDSGHVSRLVNLVESMRDLGVEQILVVSHDDELVGAADDLLHVEKDATSNRSHVSRGVDAAAAATLD